jgi:asparagine synthase (glutamine-hydrolysing)
VLAVDPFANKPMFYTVIGDLFVFASEIKALFDHPDVRPRIDWPGALREQGLLAYPAIETGKVNTWFEGVVKVEAGTVVTVDIATGRTTERRYWNPSFAPPRDPALSGLATYPRTADEYVDAYRDLLFSSVEDSLMSEVGLGLFLSGGIDSAAIAAIASRLGSPLTTFTVATEATVLNGDVAASVAVARRLGIENTVAALDVRDVPSVTDWTSLLWLLESPLAGPEQYYKFSLHRVAKQLRPDLKAMLLGTGADEFNGGYSHLLGRGAGWPVFVDQLGTVGAARADPAARWWQAAPHRALMTPAFSSDSAPPDPYEAFVRWKYRDVQQYNCWLEDRCAAGNGIEARVPFLDRRLTDLSTQMPPELRATLLWDKRMARLAMRGLLPDDVIFREKKPFFDGRTARFSHRTIRALLRQNDGALVERALAGPRMSSYIEPDALRSAVRAGTAIHTQVLLHIVNLGLLDLAAERQPAPFAADQVQLRAKPVPADALARRFATVTVGPDTVLAYGPTTVLARHASEPSRWLLLDDNSVVFTLDETTAPEWVAFLRGVDGHTPVHAIAAGGADWHDFDNYLTLCLESGYLTVAEPMPSEPE